MIQATLERSPLQTGKFSPGKNMEKKQRRLMGSRTTSPETEKNNVHRISHLGAAKTILGYFGYPLGDDRYHLGNAKTGHE
ncbi:hypothetical protein RUM43_015020 [Polyplax serrata]|uniref:Uncharacterized protein n=1 Tax=Polyplax serrata TaxID=468196 RepID=A0AAN8S3F2_POLSC